jgi:hypothetical protein
MILKFEGILEKCKVWNLGWELNWVARGFCQKHKPAKLTKNISFLSSHYQREKLLLAKTNQETNN